MRHLSEQDRENLAILGGAFVQIRAAAREPVRHGSAEAALLYIEDIADRLHNVPDLMARGSSSKVAPINLDLLCDIFKYASDCGFHVVHENENCWGARLEIAANHIKKACAHNNVSLNEAQINELARCLFGSSKGMEDFTVKKL